MKLTDVQKEVNHFTRLQKILISLIIVFILFFLIIFFTGANAVSKSGYNVFTMLRYSLIDHPIETITDWKEHLHSLNHVKEENDRLRSIIASQKMYKAESDEAKRSLKEMEELMNFETKLGFEKEYASVVYRDIATWSNTITLNKGEKDGIKKDMAVISNKGLVGKVAQVNANTCLVKLLTSENNDVSVAIKVVTKDATSEGILQKYDVNKAKYRVQIFDSLIEIEKDMEVITSGNGGVFPPGIIVGKIDTVEQMYDSKGKIVTVKPSVDFNDFDYVAILKGK